MLLVFAAFHGTPTVTDPSGWTALVSKVNTDTYRIYAKIADGSEGSTVTVGLSGSARAAAVAYRITGARNGVTTSEIAVSTAVDASTATPDPPSLTPSWGSAENYWIAVTFSSDGNFTFSSYPTSYADGQNNVQVGSGTGTAVSVAAQLLTATSEDPGVFTTVTSRSRSTYTLAVRPAVAAYTLAAAAGSYSITGTAATLRRGLKAAAGAGSYAVTGTAAGLRAARKIAAGVGSYSVTGTAATLRRGLRVSAGAGSYSVTGTAATLTKASTSAKALGADPGSYSVTGTAATLRRELRLSAGAGAYAITGASASLRSGRRVGAGAGSYSLTGTAAAIRRERRLGAGAGSYAITGTAATLTYVPVVGRVSYPSDYPQPLVNGFNAQIAMGVIRAQGPTDQKQRRVFTTMPHMFSLTFIMSVTQWGLWYQWATANGYDWFLMNLPTFYAGISGGTLSPVLIRFTSGFSANNVSGSDVQVTVTAESAPSMISQYLEAV